MPVVVAVILVSIPRGFGLGGVIGAAVITGLFAGKRRVGGDDGSALQQMQMDQALEVNGEAEIASRREDDHPATSGCRCFNGAIDGLGVEGLAVAGGAVLADVEDAGRRGCRILR